MRYWAVACDDVTLGGVNVNVEVLLAALQDADAPYIGSAAAC